MPVQQQVSPSDPFALREPIRASRVHGRRFTPSNQPLIQRASVKVRVLIRMWICSQAFDTLLARSVVSRHDLRMSAPPCHPWAEGPGDEALVQPLARPAASASNMQAQIF
jgi:hypothetical protein